VFDAEWPSARPGQYVELTVSDTGSGMDAETMRHVFEPFFTTKPRGEATGLGLSTVYGIITKAGGGIAIDSEEGMGTTFHVYLPAIGVTAPASPDRASTGAHENAQTVLVVDAEPAVLEITARILRHNGYRTLEASTCDDALSLISTHDFQLLLTDTGMPCAPLANRALAMKPGIRVLRMSGSTSGMTEPGPVTSGEEPLIRKPFTAPDLLEKVRRVLATGPAE
jgi:two-component system, cell cycle sensor histidine kinase and response regulator CckA